MAEQCAASYPRGIGCSKRSPHVRGTWLSNKIDELVKRNQTRALNVESDTRRGYEAAQFAMIFWHKHRAAPDRRDGLRMIVSW